MEMYFYEKIVNFPKFELLKSVGILLSEMVFGKLTLSHLR